MTSKLLTIATFLAVFVTADLIVFNGDTTRSVVYDLNRSALRLHEGIEHMAGRLCPKKTGSRNGRICS